MNLREPGRFVKRARQDNDRRKNPVTLPDPSYDELLEVRRLLKQTRSVKRRKLAAEHRYSRPVSLPKPPGTGVPEPQRAKTGHHYRILPSPAAVEVLRMAELLFDIRQSECVNRALIFWAERVGMRELMGRFAAGETFQRDEADKMLRDRSLGSLSVPIASLTD